jgi:hypothetical protein
MPVKATTAADGEIDAAGEDHERRAHRRDAQKGVVAEKIHQHARRGEVVDS